MKKIISLLVICLMVLPVICESWADSEALKTAKDYDRRAQEAFDKGDYSLAIELSDYAETKRTEVEVIMNQKIDEAILADAQNASESILELVREIQSKLKMAENQLVWAKSVNGDVYYPMSYSKGEQGIQNSLVALASKEYDSALQFVNDAISVLSEISEKQALPKYYVVRPWDETKDCYWNISGRAYVYNNPTLWENLYNANKANMEDPSNPDLIHPGMKIEIPSIAGEIREGTYDPSITYETFSAR